LSYNIINLFKYILCFGSTTVNYALLGYIYYLKRFVYNDAGRKIFISEFEDRINKVFLHPKLRRKTTFLNAIKLDGYKLIKYLVEDKEFKPFSLKEMI